MRTQFVIVSIILMPQNVFYTILSVRYLGVFKSFKLLKLFSNF